MNCEAIEMPMVADETNNLAEATNSLADATSNSVDATSNLADATNNRADYEVIVTDQNARRPMNAFLIFCKRHRTIVRDRFPNLENRAITKILGDWWASMNNDEKDPFTDLAQNYKDAFFKANPNFKWYKLPAPSVRPMYGTTRSYSECDDRRERLSSVSSCASLPAVPAASARCAVSSPVGVFKFADEAQMGGLSSLMISDVKIENNNDQFHANNNMDICDDKDELHRVLGETRSYFQNSSKLAEDADSDIFADEMTDIPHSDDFDSVDDEGVNGKPARTCKGKRYAAFMNQQRALPPIQRFKARTTSSSSTSSASLSPVQPSHDGQKPFTFDHLYANEMVLPQPLATQHKMMAAGDAAKYTVDGFDLEQKIQALNSENLDEYLSRKQTSKSRTKSRMPVKKKCSKAAAAKKANSARIVRAVDTLPAVVAPLSPPPAPAVGSQKRKPRKKSVTRGDVVASLQGFAAPFAGFSTFAKVKIEPTLAYGGSGLLMLAEVASSNYAI